MSSFFMSSFLAFLSFFLAAFLSFFVSFLSVLLESVEVDPASWASTKEDIERVRAAANSSVSNFFIWLDSPWLDLINTRRTHSRLNRQNRDCPGGEELYSNCTASPK